MSRTKLGLESVTYKAKITISVGRDKAIQEFPVNLKPEKISAAMKRAILSAIRALGVKTESKYKPA